MKLCQGPKCHTYVTTDRQRGPRGNKTNQTRRRSDFHYLGGNACTMTCEGDWFRKFGELAVNHFGRVEQPQVMTAENAWGNIHPMYDESYIQIENRFQQRNRLTDERREVTARGEIV
jgi:hypothetical protein